MKILSVFLIQVSGRTPQSEEYKEIGKRGPLYKHPLEYGFYLNTEGTWKREGWGRRNAWESIEKGDKVLVYCTGNVEDYSSSLSHILTVEEKVIDEENDFARLEFDEPLEELEPKIPYNEIQDMVDREELSEKMGYCGGEGFNITKVKESDLERVRESSKAGKSFVEVSRERDLNNYLEKNPDVIEPGLEMLEVRDYMPENVIPDLLFKDRSNNFLVVELKAGKANYSAIGQLASYIGALKKEDDEKVKGLLIANEFDDRAKYGAEELNIELRTYLMSFELEEV